VIAIKEDYRDKVVFKNTFSPNFPSFDVTRDAVTKQFLVGLRGAPDICWENFS